MASSLVHHPGLGAAASANFQASSDLSGLEGLVNAAADPNYHHYHHHHHQGYPHHPHAHGYHHQATQNQYHHPNQRSYFEDSSSLLTGLGSLTTSVTSAAVAAASSVASSSSNNNNESYSPNSTTNNLPSSTTVKIKTGEIPANFISIFVSSVVLMFEKFCSHTFALLTSSYLFVQMQNGFICMNMCFKEHTQMKQMS